MTFIEVPYTCHSTCAARVRGVSLPYLQVAYLKSEYGWHTLAHVSASFDRVIFSLQVIPHNDQIFGRVFRVLVK